MARPLRHTVDYFPHYIGDGKKVYIIDKKYGNDGYAVWFKLLEALAKTDDHWLDLQNSTNMLYQPSRCNVSKETMEAIITDLVTLGEFDAELWEKERVLWSDKFTSSIRDAYTKRLNNCPDREVIIELLKGLGRWKPSKRKSEEAVKPQTKLKENKPKETKEKEEAIPPLPPPPLITWAKENAPGLFKFKKPLTNEEAVRLTQMLKPNENAAFKDMLLDLENKGEKIRKENSSANLTIQKWWRNHKKWHTESQTEQKYKPEFGKPYTR